ncbi:phage late control D family protein [Comamonas sp. Y33R10-2]|uniref:contractile injection system protein, VgrG/Pvc8 family n=1 Tax=Comamonas sp. Y33R10-2 TaxID=2853257 RepID=UPI001C5CA7A4|nr:contractile injection system protein, VgrG/Pvc8 family [Comamonas sp. Y33R10-2]QXZ10265.1 phage late control D family protein [Comamonas sp. Y33R10-2]
MANAETSEESLTRERSANASHRGGNHRIPTYRLVVAGKDITPTVDARLVSLTLTEGRENQADQLDIVLTDHDGQLALPRKEAEIELQLGWQGQQLIDKGTFVVDEIEHSGAPDILTIRARAADLGGEIRKRTEKSWHDTTLAAILNALAKRNKLTHKVDAKLGATKVQHIDQTNESDMHFITRLARKYDAVATVKKKHLLFMPINGTKTSKGQSLPTIEITRIDGDQHRFASSTRDAYDGVKALWNDRKFGKRKEVIAGKKDGNLKTMKETFGSEADALAAAKAELQRINRGMATFDLNLAIGVPELMPQTPVRVVGFKPEIDGQGWLVKEVTHTLGDGGLTSKVQMERSVSEDVVSSLR